MKIFTLLLFIIALTACNTAKTTDVGEPEPAAAEEVAQEAEPVANDAAAQSNIAIAAEPAIEIDPKYLITNEGAGPFSRYETPPSKMVGYTISKEVIPQEGYGDGCGGEGEHGCEIEEYTVYENGQEAALFIVVADGVYITVFSDKFRTSKNIGVGSTIEEVTAAYPDYPAYSNYELACIRFNFNGEQIESIYISQ